ncbi:hypothetical protein [Pseudomonas sp. DWP3-1-2]|uniref:hypothetical protein n=1 Tax=Pseudomonas sp. DWP3-1-2 TaxID=2804645 RepID=UPI003CEABC89
MKNFQTQRTQAASRLRQVEQDLDAARDGLRHEDTLSGLKRIQLHEARDNAMSEQGHLQRELNRLDQLINLQRDTENADATIKTARKKIIVAQKEITKLDSNREKVAGKLAKVTGEITQLQTRAVEGEQNAAKDYAAALASGDDEAEQAAQTNLERAGDAVDDAQRKALRQQPIVNALTAELTAIDSAMAEAVEQLRTLEQEQLYAVRLKLIKEWDAAAKALIELGGKLSAVGRYGSGTSTLLDDLHIPLFGLGTRDAINRQEIDSYASTVGRADLIGA